MSAGAYHRDLVFYVNGKRRVVHDVDPRTLLVDYLRSPAVGLTGTKKVCAQGGCGSCTVALYRWNGAAQKVETLAVNSCLRPLCSLDGMAVTTVEGVGTVETEISPVQYQMAIDNGPRAPGPRPAPPTTAAPPSGPRRSSASASRTTAP